MRAFVTISAFLWLCASVPSHASFPDTTHSWYRKSIDALQAENIINGFGDGNFGPRVQVTRAEMLKIAMKAGGRRTLADSRYQCFPDLLPQAWYTEYICSAKVLGIANGHNDGKFRPDSPVTVHEAIAFLSRTMDIPLEDGTESGDWFAPYEEYADSNDLFTANRYNIDTRILRGQVAELTYHFLQRDDENGLHLSSGCGKTAKQNLSPLTVNESQRSFLQFVPQSYRKDQPHGLIIAIHGRTNSNQMVKGYMGLEGRKQWKNGSYQKKSQNDFLVVYPAGIKTSGGTYSWSSAENIQFIEQLLLTISENYCIDRRKVFLVGHSLGGFFANKLACLRGDVFRGVGIVGGSAFSGKCTGPVAGMFFHHPQDWAVSLSQGRRARDIRLAANACTDQTQDAYYREKRCSEYADCRDGNVVAWCTEYDTYGSDSHSWPIDGGNMFLEFFRSLSA